MRALFGGSDGGGLCSPQDYAYRGASVVTPSPLFGRNLIWPTAMASWLGLIGPGESLQRPRGGPQPPLR
jgi:hypothetical protein